MILKDGLKIGMLRLLRILKQTNYITPLRLLRLTLVFIQWPPSIDYYAHVSLMNPTSNVAIDGL